MGNLTVTGVVVAATALLLAAPSALGDFDAAVKAANAGDYYTAKIEFSKLADAGDARGQNGLGVLYLHGTGLDQDLRVAAEWFRHSAEQGYHAAQSNLALLYEKGWGVERDDQVAYQWYLKAALQGDADAQTSLGVLCALGRGTVQDHRAALTWFRRAAEQGDVDAWANIGHLYRAGDGVERDYVAAYAWYGIAAAGGYPMGPELRDTVAAYLTAEQLEAGRARARLLYRRYSAQAPGADASGG